MSTHAGSVLSSLQALLEERKQNQDASTSYVASLHKKGLNKILEKVGEEATEVILAAKDAQTSKSNTHLVSESADLLFHVMVMLSHLDTSLDATISELEKRFDVSGLAEKAARQNNG